MKGFVPLFFFGVILMTQLDKSLVEGADPIKCHTCAVDKEGCLKAGESDKAIPAACDAGIEGCMITFTAGGLPPFIRGCAAAGAKAGCEGEVCNCLADSCNSKDLPTDYAAAAGGDAGAGLSTAKTEETKSTGSSTLGSVPVLMLVGIAGIPLKSMIR